MRRFHRLIIAATMVAGVSFGQRQEGVESPAIERISREMRRLEIELTAYRIESHEARLKRLEKRIARIAAEERQAEAEEAGGRSELLSIMEQLARPELTAEERAELQTQQTGLLGEGQARTRERQAAAREKKLAIQGLLEKEKAIGLDLRQRLKKLRSEE